VPKTAPPQVRSIVGTLLEVLTTPSESVQRGVSDCLPALMQASCGCFGFGCRPACLCVCCLCAVVLRLRSEQIEALRPPTHLSNPGTSAKHEVSSAPH